MTTASLPRTYRDYAHSGWRRALLNQGSIIIAVLVVVTTVAIFAVPHFGQPITFTYLLRDMAPALLIALPMTLIIITGEIDLSVASIVGLASVTVGVLVQGGVPIEVAFLVALLVGAIAGLVNGLLITKIGLPSLAVTIGTLALYRGIAVGLLGTQAVTDFPKFWTDLAKARILDTPIPVSTILVVVLAIVFVVLLHFTRFGRGIYAIGLSDEAARFAGVKIERTKTILYVLSGTVSAIAGIYWTLLYNNARGDNAMGLELSVIAAVLLGGVSIFGGTGALHGVLAGVLLIGTLASALRLANVTSDVINIITGVLLVLSVVSTSFLRWLKTARSKPRRTRTVER